MAATKTLKVRVKDRHAHQLRQMARSVNFVWNFLNELSHKAITERGQWLSAYDMHKYTVGAAKELGLHSHTPQRVAAEYVKARKQFRKNRLAWRKSGGARRSLGWVPINTGMAQWKNGQVFHNGTHFKVWDSWGLSQYKFRSASFSEDSRGRWYFNVVVDVQPKISKGQEAVGIDLGLKTTATCSNGQFVEAGRFYRDMQGKLGIAQRARNKRRVKAIHAKIANRRKDAQHKFSTALVQSSGEIYVGNVLPKALVKTRMAKSVLDAGWSSLKTMLEYKCDHAGIVYREVNETYSTQTCSCCGALPHSSPKGRAGLGIREWQCSDCGAVHDRDINAAKNILAVGLHRLAEERVAA